MLNRDFLQQYLMSDSDFFDEVYPFLFVLNDFYDYDDLVQDKEDYYAELGSE